MQAALFSIVPYGGPIRQDSWPVPVAEYSSEVAQASMERALDNFELADQLGFDWVSVAEHHYAPGSLTPNPMVMAAAAAQRVKRAKIALLGSTIPIQNPVRVAEELAMLDTLSGGRLVAGMLRGTSNEYVTYGVNPAESRERFVEALKLIIRAWTEPQPFGWLGRYYEYRTISIWPRPVQQPHPPIFMSISSPEMAQLAAANHISAGFAVTTVALAKPSLELYRRAAADHGWEPGPEQVLYRMRAHITDTDDEAWSDLAPQTQVQERPAFSKANPAIDEAVASSGYYGRDLERQRGRSYAGTELAEQVQVGRLLLGSPERVLEQVRAIHDQLGVGILELTFAGPTAEKTRRGIELFGKEILPQIREW
jgi:alkanesulfonate monooxygenase SsuD/methylene tetrahydromethanopterin reductase-like flavin-dependent oxidoreductase (luciferase family)